MQNDIFSELTEEELSRYAEDTAPDMEKENEKTRNTRKKLLLALKNRNESISDLIKKAQVSIDEWDEEGLRLLVNLMTNEENKLRDKLWKLDSTISPWTPDPSLQGQSTKRVCRPEDIIIKPVEEGYWIYLPYKMPKKKNLRSDTRDYYRMPLYQALFKYLDKRPRIYQERAVIIFVNCYEKAYGTSICDYDNLSYGFTINALADMFMGDDSPPFYSLCVDYKNAKADHTEILIGPERNREKYLKLYKKPYNEI
ncbi:MAG: hypothetical protein J5966_11240 [Lachnospiraceae bacterium]|nr:hypothetical protein [Lachnospiraceae bacterium]